MKQTAKDIYFDMFFYLLQTEHKVPCTDLIYVYKNMVQQLLFILYNHDQIG